MSDTQSFTTPRRQLRSLALKNAVKSYVCQPVLRSYDVASVRALLHTEDSFELWEIRRKLEHMLNEDKNVVFFVSCITAIEKNVSKKRKNDEESDDDADSVDKKTVPGIAFWIAFDWPQYGMEAYENHIRQIFMEANVDPLNCTAIRGRGKNLYISLFFLFCISVYYIFY